MFNNDYLLRFLQAVAEQPMRFSVPSEMSDYLYAAKLASDGLLARRDLFENGKQIAVFYLTDKGRSMISQLLRDFSASYLSPQTTPRDHLKKLLVSFAHTLAWICGIGGFILSLFQFFKN